MIRRAAGCGLLLLFTLVLAPAGSLADEHERRVSQAFELLSSGKLAEGRDLLEAAIEQSSALDVATASLLLRLSQAEVNLGRYAAALVAAERALEIHEALNDPEGRAEAHHRIGAAYDELADYDLSHLHYDKALQLFRETGNRLGEANILSGLGTSYRYLADPETALRFYEQSRAMFQELNQLSSLCFAHRHLGIVLEDLGRPRQANEQYRRALELLEGWDQGWGRADLLFHLGRLESREGDRATALKLLEEGLDRARSSGNSWAEARTLVELARLHGLEDRPRSGLALVDQGLRRLRTMGAQDLEWDALFVRAGLLEQAGDPGAASQVYAESLRVLDAVRSTIGLPMLRTRYTPRSRAVYESVIRLQSYWPEAESPRRRAESMFETAERNRARTFGEMLLSSRTDTAPAEDARHREERRLRAKVSALRTRLTRFAATVADRPAVEAELLEAERRLSALQIELQQRDPRYREIPSSALFVLDGAAPLLDEGASLVAYHLGEKDSFGWHLSADGVQVFDLPLRRDVENLVLLFRSLAVHRNDSDALRLAASKLFDLLLGPVAAQLKPEARLIVIPDGALAYLPFEALLAPDAGRRRFLVEQHAVSYAPSVAVLLDLIGRPPTDSGDDPRDLLVFGDPEIGEGSTESPLAHARSEVDGISRMFNARHREARTGRRASESAFRELAARPTRIVHLATHGILDGAHPERSGLFFAVDKDVSDGFLNLHEVFTLRLDADLVVLSGCETARGELLRGEGVMGLTQAFMFAGARGVVSSLWAVDDHSTEQLMVPFYRELSHGATPANALRQAKIERIEQAGADAMDPFGWAAFVLAGQGDRPIQLAGPSRTGAWMALAAGLALLALSLTAAFRRVRPGF